MTLFGPKDLTTRPITDRVKESLFAILTPRLPDATVADLFCGTGSMGLEALSRGASHAFFVDLDRDALGRLQKNLTRLDFESQATVIRADIFRRGIPSIPDAEQPQVDLVFLDPPYRLSRRTKETDPLGKLLLRLADQLRHRALVVVRHEKNASLRPPYSTLHELDYREYGSMAITMLENVRE